MFRFFGPTYILDLAYPSTSHTQRSNQWRSHKSGNGTKMLVHMVDYRIGKIQCNVTDTVV